MNDYTIVYVTNRLGVDTPLVDCPTFDTTACSEEHAIQNLYDLVPDVLSGYVATTHQS